MAITTRLEAGLTVVPGETVFTITYPSGGTDYDVSLPRAYYPHRNAVIEALNAELDDLPLPITLSENYSDTLISFGSGGSNFDLTWPDPSEAATWLGAEPGDIASNKSSVTLGASTALVQLEDPVFDESYKVALNRTSNFSDDGRVGAVLVGRCVSHRFSVFVAPEEHDDWVAFWPWVSDTRKVTLLRRFDSSKSAAQQYLNQPLHGSGKMKWLHLDSETADEIDNPAQEPDVNGHVFTLTGTVYGV